MNIDTHEYFQTFTRARYTHTHRHESEQGAAHRVLRIDVRPCAHEGQDGARARRRSRPVKRGLPELFHRSCQRASEGGEREKEKEGEREGRGKRRRRERGVGGGGRERP